MSNPSAPPSSAPSSPGLPPPVTAPSTGLSRRSREVEDRRFHVMELMITPHSGAFVGATIGGIVGQDFLTPVGELLAKLLIVYVGIALLRVFLGIQFRIGL